MKIIAETQEENRLLEDVAAMLFNCKGCDYVDQYQYGEAVISVHWGAEDVRRLCRKYGIKMTVSDMVGLLKAIEDEMSEAQCPSGWDMLEDEFKKFNEISSADYGDEENMDDYSIETDIPE